jgi:isoleucyl-tRNA synthetase
MREANATVEWTPEYMGKRMDDWLVNMSDWNISRRRYYGLPLPFYPCAACGHLEVVGSKADLARLATTSLDGLAELRRPWIDRIAIRCPGCGAEVQRITEVGDVWLDAGIVPFSTLGWENPEWIDEGYATGAAKGLTTADLPDHAYWEEWYPADWVSEMREQIRLWFYSQLFMSVALTGKAPFRKVLGYEKMLDERGREMHGSWGNMIDAPDAFTQMGADVMRWLYCAQPPTQNLLFGFGPGHEIQRKLLTLWNSASFFVQYANIAGFTPRYSDLKKRPAAVDDHLDRWMFARTHQLVAEATTAYDDYLTVNVLRAFESWVDDLSNWYVRRSRRRFWDGDEAALRTLWACLVNGLRVIAPVMPFLGEHLWQVLVVDQVRNAPDSVFLAEWPQATRIQRSLLADERAVRQAVDLGRQARAASKLRTRQPLRRMVVEGLDRATAHAADIAEELRIKEVTFGPIDATDLRVRPNLKVLGPRLGAGLGAVRAALEAGAWEQLDGGAFRVAGHDLGPDDVLVERTEKPGWTVVSNEGVSVAIDISLDDELLVEGRVWDAIHHVNGMRKDAGLELTDRIRLFLAASDADLLPHAEWLGSDTLAVSVQVSDDPEMSIEKA